MDTFEGWRVGGAIEAFLGCIFSTYISSMKNVASGRDMLTTFMGIIRLVYCNNILKLLFKSVHFYVIISLVYNALS